MGSNAQVFGVASIISIEFSNASRRSGQSWQKCLPHVARPGGSHQNDTDSKRHKEPRPLRIVDLGSCNGFFALKAAYRRGMEG